MTHKRSHSGRAGWALDRRVSRGIGKRTTSSASFRLAFDREEAHNAYLAAKRQQHEGCTI